MSPAEALELMARRSLTEEEAAAVFRRLATGDVEPLQAAALLAAFKARGETGEVLVGAAEALLAAAVAFPRPVRDFADCCGTGGDGAGTVNVSTAAMFVAAEGGLPVAKHGNHKVSSRCGSADILRALGAEIAATPRVARRCLDLSGAAYLHAPRYHPAVGRIAAVRRALGTRTVFNVLGPLLNPARPPIRLVGVYSRAMVRPVARALAVLGCRSGLVVHGDGLDEIAIHGPTTAARIEGDRVTPCVITPEEAGLERAPLAALKGGGPEENAAWLAGLLAGKGAREHEAAVAINAGALLHVAGRAGSLREGAATAREILRSGTARHRLEQFVELSHGS